MTFNPDDDDLYQSYMQDPYTGKTREFYATIDDTAVMLARVKQPHSLGGWMISHLSGEVIPLEGMDRAKVVARAREMKKSFGSTHDVS